MSSTVLSGRLGRGGATEGGGEGRMLTGCLSCKGMRLGVAQSRVGWRVTHLEVCVQSSGKGRVSVNPQVPKCQVKDRGLYLAWEDFEGAPVGG